MKVSDARNIALRVLMRVEKGSFADNELGENFRKSVVSSRDHALATELVYGVLRWKYRLDNFIDQHTRVPSKKMPVCLRQILRIAAYQFVFLTRVPPHAIVNEAVNQARLRFDQKRAAFVNAILRAMLNNGQTKDTPSSSDALTLSRYYSHPLWLVQRWLHDLGFEHTVRALSVNNMPAPLICRVNELKTTARDLFASLEKEGMDCKPSCLPAAFQLHTRGRSLSESSSYRQGLYTVQDIASQMIAPLVQCIPGLRVLDACAAPGGKTAHMAALCNDNVSITAVDISQKRVADARKNLERLGIKCAHYLAGDLTDAGFTSTLGKFHRILIDAPCSGLGVLRRNPEARYRVKEEDLSAFASRQMQIVRSLAPLLESGGKMVYSVCTVTREETQNVLSRIISECPNLRLDRIEGRELRGMSNFLTKDGYLETFPPSEDCMVDGFFAARLMRDINVRIN